MAKSRWKALWGEGPCMQGQVMRKSHSTATQQEGHIADEWQGCPVAQTVSRRTSGENLHA